MDLDTTHDAPLGHLDPSEDETEAEDQSPDYFYNPDRRAQSEAAKALIAGIIKTTDRAAFDIGSRRRVQRAKDRDAYERTVEAIISDVAYHHLNDPGRRIAISRSKTTLDRRSRYRAETYGRRVPGILDLLAHPSVGLLTQATGDQGPKTFSARTTGGKRTTIAAGPVLVDQLEEADLDPRDFAEDGCQEVIILRQAPKDFWDRATAVEYDDTEATVRYRAEVTEINQWLAEADLTFDPGALMRPLRVDTRDRRLRRLFTRQSFESGGRLFGGFWQQLKEGERLQGLRINSEPVVSLDYRQMTPRLLYAQVQSTAAEGDHYALGYLRFHREGVKKVFNAALFSDTPLTRLPKGTRTLLPRSCKVGDVIEVIERHHPALAGHLFTGIGHYLQFVESTILVTVLLRLKAERITALPIHDAVVVAVTDQETTQAVMEEVFTEVSGGRGEVKVTRMSE